MRELLEHIMEAGIFKPAPKEEIEKRKAAKVAARKKKEDAWERENGHPPDICPHCSANLREEGVDEYGTSTWSGHRYYDYDTNTWDEFSEDTEDSNYETDGFTCPACGEDLEHEEDFDHYELQESVLNEAEDIFKPVPKEELDVRKEAARKAEEIRKAEVFKRKQEASKTFPKEWMVRALTINHPFMKPDGSYSSWEDSHTGMIEWWKNNRQWKDRGIKKIDTYWDRIIFTFDEPLRHSKAVRLVREFLTDWSEKPQTVGKVAPVVDDAVFIMREGSNYDGHRVYYREDTGRVTKVAGEDIRVRFHHHGNANIKLSMLKYDPEDNSWKMQETPEFVALMTQKKGLPVAGASATIKMPKADWVTNRHHGGVTKTQGGTVVSVDGENVTVKYRKPKKDYMDPENPEKTITIPLKDLEYDWYGKEWIHKAVTGQE